MKKKVLLIIVVLLLSLSLVGFASGEIGHEIQVRIEGQEGTHFESIVQWNGSDDVLVFLKDAIGQDNVEGTNGSYGFMIESLYGEKGITGVDYSTSWGLYIDEGDGLISSPVGISSLALDHVQALVLHIKATTPAYASLTNLPRIQMNGQSLEVVKEITTYDDDWNSIVSQEPVEGAVVVFQDQEMGVTSGAAVTITLNDFDEKIYLSDEKVSIDLSHLNPGNYLVKIEKSGENYPVLVSSFFVLEKTEELSNPYSDLDGTLKDLKASYNLENTLSWREALSILSVTDPIGSDIYNLIERKFELSDSESAGAYVGNIIGILASGRDPYDYQGENHVEKLVAAQDAQGKFIIGDYDDHPATLAYVLLALDAVKANYNEIEATEALLETQNEATGSINDVDTTAMVLTALGQHRSLSGVSEAIERGLGYIKSQQQDNGGFVAWGSDNPYTAATVLNALIANGEDVFSSEWTKNEKNIVDALLAYQVGDHFEYSSDYGKDIDGVTEQAFLALSNVYNKKLSFKGLKVKNMSGSPEENFDAFDISFDNESNLENGKAANVRVEVTNNLTSDQEAVLVVGVYDQKTHELINYSFITDTIKSKETINFGSGLLIPKTGDYVIKGFIWDNLRDQNVILTTPVVLEIQE